MAWLKTAMKIVFITRSFLWFALAGMVTRGDLSSTPVADMLETLCCAKPGPSLPGMLYDAARRMAGSCAATCSS